MERESQVVNLQHKLSLFTERWTPKIIGEANGQQLKLAKCEGEFVWHAHEHEDEIFLVLQGRLTLEMRERSVELGPGELFVMPKGVEHRPVCHGEVHLLLMEPASTAHTGDVQSELTVNDQEWI